MVLDLNMNSSFENESIRSEENAQKVVSDLFAIHRNAVNRFVLSIYPNVTESEEIVQETFITALKKASQFEEGTNFLNWVFTIAKFKVLGLHRSNRREQLLMSELTMDVLITHYSEIETSDSSWNETLKKNALQFCRSQLTQRNQQLLKYRYDDGWKPGKIAEFLGQKSGSIYTALSKIRSFLRKCMDIRMKESINEI